MDNKDNLGLKIRCRLDGVSFKKADTFTNDAGQVIEYGTAVKLDCSVPYVYEEDGIQSVTNKHVTIKIPILEDDEKDTKLKSTLNHWSKSIGKIVESSLNVQNSQTLRAGDDIHIVG